MGSSEWKHGSISGEFLGSQLEVNGSNFADNEMESRNRSAGKEEA